MPPFVKGGHDIILCPLRTSNTVTFNSALIFPRIGQTSFAYHEDVPQSVALPILSIASEKELLT
jgi:hypothetical protein